MSTRFEAFKSRLLTPPNRANGSIQVIRDSPPCHRQPLSSATRTIMRMVARRRISLRFGALRPQGAELAESAEHLHHAFLGHLGIFAATNGYAPGLLCRSWTGIYATLCRARNSAARARPQRRQRQRRLAWSTFRLSGVSKWPFQQMPGMVMGSRTGSGEKHTT